MEKSVNHEVSNDALNDECELFLTPTVSIPKKHWLGNLKVTDFHNLVSHDYFIMADSGGVQKEIPSLNKPGLVLIDTIERPEGVNAGTL